MTFYNQLMRKIAETGKSINNLEVQNYLNELIQAELFPLIEKSAILLKYWPQAQAFYQEIHRRTI